MQFILYCLCGGLGVSSDYAVFWLATHNEVGYQLANLMGYATGTLVSFTLNRIITFQMHDRVVQRLLMFLSVAAVGLSASALMLWVLIDLFQANAQVAKLLTLPMVVVLQF